MTQLIVPVSIDSTMSFGSPDTNFGAAPTISCGVIFAGGSKTDTRRGIGNFDVSAIPPGAIIDACEMRREISLVDPVPHTVEIDRCTRPNDWTEMGVTWNKYDGVNNWALGGGTYDETTPPGVAFTEATAPGPHVVSGLSAFITDAIANRGGIVSVIMRNVNEAPSQSERSAWLQQSFWTLAIDYTVAGAALTLGRRTDTIGHRDPRAARPAAASSPAAPARPYRPARRLTP